MALNRHCQFCLRSLQQQVRRDQYANLSRQLPKSFRSFSSSSSRPQSSLPASASQSLPTPLKFETKKSPPQNAEIPVGELSTSKKLAVEARRRLPSVTETYVAYGAAEKLVKECARQAAYSIPQRNVKDAEIPKTAEGEDLGIGEGWWYETLGLTPTFNTWAQITFLHMYLLTVRMRCFVPEHAPKWHQHLLDHFFYLAEDKMVTIHNVHSRAIRNKYLKDLFVQWRGCLAGYDEGLIRGDAVLATAIWRNVFKADENVDLRGLGELVSYIRGVLKGLDGMKDEAIASGEVVFGDPGSELAGVLARSAMMASLDEPSAGEPLSIKTPPS